MARYRKVHVCVWADAKFRALSSPNPNGQSLWLYLLTGPHTTQIPGLFTGGEAGLAEALGWPLEGFRKAFREVFSQGMVEADWKARVVWLPNAPKYNPPESPNVALSWLRALDEIADCPLKDKAVKALKAFLEGLGQGFAKGFPAKIVLGACSPSPNQEQEQDTGVGTGVEEETDLPTVVGGEVFEVSDSGKPAGKKADKKPKPKNPKPKAEPKPRERNLYWDAVCDIFGMNPVTEQDQKRMGRLARDFKLKCEAIDVDPDEIEARRDVLAARWAKDDVPAVVTPEALLKHWDSAEDQSQSVDFRDPTPEETAMYYADFDAQPAAVKKPKLEAFLKRLADIGQTPDEETAARCAKIRADIEAEEALEGAGA